MKKHPKLVCCLLAFSAVFLMALQVLVGLSVVIQLTVAALVGLLARHSWCLANEIKRLRVGEAVNLFANRQTRRRSPKSEILPTVRL